jgi:phosphoribosylanthranilate isomerase
MKLRQLKAETSTEEVIEYLRKRHPLYFIANKISNEQINDLVNRLKFKIKQLHGISTKPTDTSKKENNNTMPVSSASSQPMTKQAPPSITTPTTTSSLLGPLPSLGNGTSFKSGS